MKSKFSSILTLCCLLVSLSYNEAMAANLGPQLVPLPAMAQVGPVMAQEGPPASFDQGEVQFIQPNVTLFVDKGSVDQFDFKKPPIQKEIAVDVNVVKKPINESATSPPNTLFTAGVETDIQSGFGGSDLGIAFAETKEPDNTTKDPNKKNAGTQINASFYITMVIMVATGFMVNLASKTVI